jgi:hypothetical protein
VVSAAHAQTPDTRINPAIQQIVDAVSQDRIPATLRNASITNGPLLLRRSLDFQQRPEVGYGWHHQAVFDLKWACEFLWI